MADYLRQHGFHVRVADGGETMFACLEDEKPDLIVPTPEYNSLLYESEWREFLPLLLPNLP